MMLQERYTRHIKLRTNRKTQKNFFNTNHILQPMLLYLLNTNIIKFICIILNLVGSLFAMIAHLTISIQVSIQVFLEVIEMCEVLQHHAEGNHWQCHYTCFFIFSFRIKHCSSFDGIWILGGLAAKKKRILGGFFISLMDNETHSFYLSYRLHSFF